MLDAMRLVATAGVIWAHCPGTGPWRQWGLLGRFGVPFYLMAAILFMTRSFAKNPDRSVISYLALRARRVLIPFLAWDAIHYLFSEAKRVVLNQPPRVWNASELIQGVSFHLWFLPFLFMVTVIAAPSIRLALRNRAVWMVTTLLFSILGFAFLIIKEPYWLTMDRDLAPTVVFHNFWEALPAAMFAIPMALLFCKPLPHRTASIMGWVGLVVCISGSVALALAGYTYDHWLWFRTFSGIGLLFMALCPLRGSFIRWMGYWGRMSFGIYLCHMIVMTMVHLALNKLHVNPVSPAADVFVFVTTFAGSSVMTWWMSRYAALAWIVGQESPKRQKPQPVAETHPQQATDKTLPEPAV